MITNILINLVVLILGAVFSWLPKVDKLPTIAGYDFDTPLASGIAQMHTWFVTFWPIQIMFEGFLVLMIYYGIKMTVRFVLGHRAPGK